MGLDMYLYKQRYFSDYYKNKPHIEDFDDCDSIEVKGKALYWRKANAIHRWFVENVQNGNDNCDTYYVSKEQLQSLLDVVNEVLEKSILGDGLVNVGTQYEKGKVFELMEKGKYIVNPKIAQELLPSSSGFFFWKHRL